MQPRRIRERFLYMVSMMLAPRPGEGTAEFPAQHLHVVQSARHHRHSDLNLLPGPGEQAAYTAAISERHNGAHWAYEALPPAA